ncbi:MAG: hypothetical protein ACOCUT_00095 [bacterium]
MDIYCQRCDEPWDVYYVCHDMDNDSEPNEYGPNGEKPSERFKQGIGCPACNWGTKAPKQQSLRGEAMSVLADMLGDDVDGMASMMDDFEFLGMLEE